LFFPIYLKEEQHSPKLMTSTTEVLELVSGNYLIPAHIAELLQQRSIRATPAVVEFLLQHPGREPQKLEEIVGQIRAGGFDPGNRLHLELEYSRFLSDAIKIPEGSALRHSNISCADDLLKLARVGSTVPILSEVEHQIALSLVEEAVAVFHYIVNEHQTPNPKLVIANKRYGSMFIVSPIEKYLVEKGIHVVHEEIKSSGKRDSDHAEYVKGGNISVSTWKWVLEHNPDIFVVDGSNHPDYEGSTRYPRSIERYIARFREYNIACGMTTAYGPVNSGNMRSLRSLGASHPYYFKFWAPELTETFWVGGTPQSQMPRRDEPRTLVLMNPIRRGKESSQGIFDDPDKYISGYRLGISDSGLCLYKICSTEEEFVVGIQEVMSAEIKKQLG